MSAAGAVAPPVQRPPPTSEMTAKLSALAMTRQKLTNNDRLKIIQSDPSSHLTSMTSFAEMNLPPYLLQGIYSMGFDKPSAIQAVSLPRILGEPQNLIAQAQSGSGKTVCFCLGMLYRVDVALQQPQAVCVTPTRELAVQIVTNCLKPMGSFIENLGIRLALSGEMADRSGVREHIVVGTPGKVCDWLKRRLLNPATVKVFALDEADQMCAESGHRANSILIKKCLPPTCQCLFFSATYPQNVLEFSEKMVGTADKILLKSDEELVLDVIKQIWIDTGAYGKIKFLEDMYSLMEIGQSIVFVETRRTADEVANTLISNGYSCSVLHSKVENQIRDGLMEAFRRGESKVLITTNVLARGVDVENVCLVVNYDIPRTRDVQIGRDGQQEMVGPSKPDYETYLHRIGRTGRFGRKGTAVNLVDTKESMQFLAEIEQHFSPQKEMIVKCDADPEQLADLLELA